MSEIKFPTNQAEYDEIKKTLRSEIGDEDLDAIVGGNDCTQIKGKTDPAVPWVCPGCGATVMIRQKMDAAKHMTKCPGNPYK